jgi:hypothetical protein
MRFGTLAAHMAGQSSNFSFLKAEWPELLDAASKAKALANLDSPMASARLTALFDTLQHRTSRGEL